MHTFYVTTWGLDDNLDFCITTWVVENRPNVQSEVKIVMVKVKMGVVWKLERM